MTTALVQQCSDQSFPVAPPQVECSTKDDHPQTFHANVARGRYYNEKFGKDKLHGVYVFGNDSKQARDSSFVSLGALRDIGIKSDQDFDLRGFDAAVGVHAGDPGDEGQRLQLRPGDHRERRWC